jgi:hypothetical protein
MLKRGTMTPSSTRPACIDATAQASSARTAPPSTPSPTNRKKAFANSKKRATPEVSNENDKGARQQQLSTPKSTKRQPEAIARLTNSNSKRSRRSAAVSFSPHLSIVHEFDSGSPSKRRLDYRYGRGSVMDDELVRLELDAQGHKIAPTETINASHRELVEQMHARDLVEELARAGLEPQPKDSPSEFMPSGSPEEVHVPVPTAITQDSKGKAALSFDEGKQSPRATRMSNRTSAKENSASLPAISMAVACDTNVTHSIEELRSRVKVRAFLATNKRHHNLFVIVFVFVYMFESNHSHP